MRLAVFFINKIILRQWAKVALMACITAMLAGCSGLSKPEAQTILLNSDGAMQKNIYIDLGYLNAHCGQPPTTGKYAVLRKAGFISIDKPDANIEILTTRKGDAAFKQVGAQRLELATLKLVSGQTRCNFRGWAVPIASREVIGVTITPTSSSTADVVYNWKWAPNEIGEAFMTTSDVYKSLTTHQQESLSDGELPLDNSFPHATKVNFIHDGAGWHLQS